MVRFYEPPRHRHSGAGSSCVQTTSLSLQHPTMPTTTTTTTAATTATTKTAITRATTVPQPPQMQQPQHPQQPQQPTVRVLVLPPEGGFERPGVRIHSTCSGSPGPGPQWVVGSGPGEPWSCYRRSHRTADARSTTILRIGREYVAATVPT